MYVPSSIPSTSLQRRAQGNPAMLGRRLAQRAAPLARPLLSPLDGGATRGAAVIAAAAGKQDGSGGGGSKGKQGGGGGSGKRAKKDAASSAAGGAGSGPYSATVTTPVTDFSLRANSVAREPEIQRHWQQADVYERLCTGNPGDPFTLHDGPPYANGDLHIGHALNKVLKDFINRYQLLQGRRARFVPGWDTHGLPIELKVLQGLPQAERAALDTIGLRTKAREFALKTVEEQKAQFQRYGVWGDWASPYVTLQPRYEAAQLRVFGQMFLRGHIYRGRKPVHWSPSSRTALAEAELEYPDGHTSRSIYVAMPITELGPDLPKEARVALEGEEGSEGGGEGKTSAAFAVWTTTPWTIPANLAVAVNGDLDYCVVRAEGDAAAGWLSRRLVVAEALVDALAEKLGASLTVLATVTGEQLQGCRYSHPLYERVSPLVLGGDYITTESGTGLVHTAPGHGQEDYLVGMRHGLPLLSPVDDAGNFTDEAGPRFAGLSVQGDGNAAVVDALRERGALLREESYAHKYPYDWRTKKPTIFRATSQWFASVEGFRAEALEAIRNVSWVPPVGENRITSMTEGRSDWCISRQRKWGVPIPVFYDKTTGEPLITPETLEHVTKVVEQCGSDAWWTSPIEELLPPALAGKAGELERGEDTMDVWFDSGSSWAGVVQERADEGLRFPADLYLEGSDQHRGWFQSSLLTSVAATGSAPYRQVLTHGFVLDEKGNKMSKSLGNVVDPRVVIEGGKDQKQQPPYGADVLRLWVASVDYANDVMIGPGILKQVAEAYRKLRGTLRFLLGNLSDYDPAKDAVEYDELPQVDRWLLARHARVMADVRDAYESYQFRRAYQSALNFVSGDLSSFYLDAAKDRMYVQAPNSASRRACQTVQHAVLRGLLSSLAPILPHLAEDAWLNLPAGVKGSASSPAAAAPAGAAESVFLAGWAEPEAAWWAAAEAAASAAQAEEMARWDALVGPVREAVAKALEGARAAKQLGSSLEARVSLHVSDGAYASWLKGLNGAGNGADELKYLLIVSGVDLVGFAEAAADGALSSFVSGGSSGGGGGDNGGPGVTGAVTAGVRRAEGSKCARCWAYSPEVGVGGGALALFPDLCERCAPVVSAIPGFRLPGVATVGGDDGDDSSGGGGGDGSSGGGDDAAPAAKKQKAGATAAAA